MGEGAIRTSGRSIRRILTRRHEHSEIVLGASVIRMNFERALHMAGRLVRASPLPPARRRDCCARRRSVDRWQRLAQGTPRPPAGRARDRSSTPRLLCASAKSALMASAARNSRSASAGLPVGVERVPKVETQPIVARLEGDRRSQMIHRLARFASA